VLDMTLRDIERVLYFEAYVITDPGMTPLKKFGIMSEDDYDAKRKEYGDEYVAKMGAEGIKDLLEGIDIDVEIEDPLKVHMNNFVLSTTNQQEITQLDNKIHETVDTINQLKTNREFFLSFCKDPQQFIARWLMSQNRDLKVMQDVAGNPEEERRSDFFYQPWTQEGVLRYFYSKVQLRRAELEQALGIRNS